jgi:CubicO group peptidase (beta-lactamase class C family)
MNMRKLILKSMAAGCVLALALALFSDRPGRRDSALGRTPQGDAFEEIDAYIERQMERLNIPGAALAVVEGNEIAHLRGFGRARPGSEEPTPQTPLVIGSLTKSFTALAVMQLVEAGKIELDAPVQRYLPWFRVAEPRASARITVRHLLNQTSGLPTSAGEIQLADLDQSPSATERQARALSTLELTRPVGSAFEYSNANYSLLGLVVEAASGESYADYVQEHIFAPLGMTHSYTSQAVAQQNGLAVGHQYWFAIPFAAPNMPIPHGSLPAAGLISSSEDLARYLIAHLNEGRYGDVQVLSGAGVEDLHRGAADFSAMGLSLGKYGMGWFVDKIGQTKMLWHTGTLPHFGAYMALLPEQEKGVVLLFNACHHWYNPVQAEFGAGVAALLAGEQPAPGLFIRMVPWALRGQLLIPILQIGGIVATLRLLRRWRLDPERRPSGRGVRGLHVLLPLIPDLSLALTLLRVLGKRRGYLKLYMPDYSRTAMVCGSFALVWMVLRTGLVVRTLRKVSLS